MASIIWKPWMTGLVLLAMASTAFLGGCGSNNKNGASPIRTYNSNKPGQNTPNQNSKLNRLGTGQVEADKTPVEVSVIKQVLGQAHNVLFRQVWEKVVNNKNDPGSVFQYMKTRLDVHSPKEGWAAKIDLCPQQQKIQSKVKIVNNLETTSVSPQINKNAGQLNGKPGFVNPSSSQNQMQNNSSSPEVDFYLVKTCTRDFNSQDLPVATFRFLKNRTLLRMEFLVASMPEAVGAGRAYQAMTDQSKKSVVCLVELSNEAKVNSLDCVDLGQTLSQQSGVETFVDFTNFSYNPKGADLNISQFAQASRSQLPELVSDQKADPKKIIQLHAQGLLYNYTVEKGSIERARSDDFKADIDISIANVGPVEIVENATTPAQAEARKRELERRNDPNSANQRQAPIEPVAPPAPPPQAPVDPQQVRENQDQQNQQAQDEQKQKAQEAAAKAAAEKQKVLAKDKQAALDPQQQPQRQEQSVSDRQEQNDSSLAQVAVDQKVNDKEAASGNGGVVPSFR